MSTNDGSKTGWTDKERLTYLFALIENSNVKFDYNSTPRPTGRSIIACQRMMERLKATHKQDVDALLAGNFIGEGGTPKKKKKTATPRKRKAKAEKEKGEGDGDVGTPSKRGRKKKGVVEEEVEEESMGGVGSGEEEEMARVKAEVKQEEGEEEV